MCRWIEVLGRRLRSVSCRLRLADDLPVAATKQSFGAVNFLGLSRP